MNSAAYSLKYRINVSVRNTQASPNSFVPAKLTEDQLQARINAADKMVQKRLTDKQKMAVHKTGMENLAGKMLRAANEREVVNGIGDAAYWSPLGNGSLHVLAGRTALTISPSIADDQAGNLEVAKKVFTIILD